MDFKINTECLLCHLRGSIEITNGLGDDFKKPKLTPMFVREKVLNP